MNKVITSNRNNNAVPRPCHFHDYLGKLIRRSVKKLEYCITVNNIMAFALVATVRKTFETI